jgi:CRISPR-associated protein Csd2
MKLCGLYVYSHSDAFGRAPAASLTSRIRLTREHADKPPRAYTDYTRIIANDGLPDGVTFWAGADLWP